MLIAMGIADICRRLTGFACGCQLWLRRLRWSSHCAALGGLWHLGDIALLVIAAAASIGWLVLCARAEETGEREWAPLVAVRCGGRAAGSVVGLGF